MEDRDDKTHKNTYTEGCYEDQDAPLKVIVLNLAPQKDDDEDYKQERKWNGANHGYVVLLLKVRFRLCF